MGDAELVFVLWAVALGALSAVSLPLGSLIGLTLRPPLKLAAVFAAFGAGALIAALTVELVAPTVEAAAHGPAEVRAFWALVAGCIVGGVAFVALDRVIASRGGFLRKVSTTITWFTRAQQQRHREMLEQLCAVPLLRMLPPDQVELVVDDVRPELPRGSRFWTSISIPMVDAPFRLGRVTTISPRTRSGSSPRIWMTCWAGQARLAISTRTGLTTSYVGRR